MTLRPTDQIIDELAARAQDGDGPAFVELVSLTRQKAFSLAFRLLGENDDARDVTQEGFIRVWENLQRYNRGSRFEPWLYRIVTNLAIDRLRARKRWWGLFRRTEEVASDEQPAVLETEDAVANAELASLIKSVAQLLPEKQRLVFILRDLQDCSVAEVSSILHISQESVKTNLHYARKHIGEVLHRQHGIGKGRP